MQRGVVVVNQHGDNRGDEAAMRAMVHQLSEGLHDPHFTVIHQFADPSSEVELDVPVDYISLKLPLLEGLGLALFGLLNFARLPADWALGKIGRTIVERYREAAVVISAPGGPYFGDMYADHEVVHWFYVWLGRILDRPLFLYAPSAGPFHNRLLQMVRRRGFRWFDAIALRDAVSAEYLSHFMGAGFEFEVTSDSALQEIEQPGMPRRIESRFVLVVAVRDPGSDLREVYDEAVLAAIESVCRHRPTEVVFLPQLHGPRHRDQPYLEALASGVKTAYSVRVESDVEIDSNDHRRIIAEADMVIAGRYHPAVFAVAAATPVLVIPYEHKSWGLARKAGIEEWTVDQHDARSDVLVSVADDILQKLDEIRSLLTERRQSMRQTALRSTELALQVAADR